MQFNGNNIFNTNAGNVGVATQNPAFRLEVNGTIGLNSTLDQRNFNPSGIPLEPGSILHKVNANLGGLIIHSSSNNANTMNMFWGQNFDYHTNNDIRYRINGPVTTMQFVNGNMYFLYRCGGRSRSANTPISRFRPKFSLANAGGNCNWIGLCYC